MKAIRLLSFALPLLFLSTAQEKEMDFGNFSMTTPARWTVVEEPSTDRFTGYIVLDYQDTIQVYYGKVLDKLEYNRGFYLQNDSIFQFQPKTDKAKPKQDRFYGLAADVNFRKLSNVDVSEVKIDAKKATLCIPKTSGIGTTSVHFRYNSKNGQKRSLLLSGFYLSPENQSLFLKAIKTIRIRD
jgi:hypothetical protein